MLLLHYHGNLIQSWLVTCLGSGYFTSTLKITDSGTNWRTWKFRTQLLYKDMYMSIDIFSCLPPWGLEILWSAHPEVLLTLYHTHAHICVMATPTFWPMKSHTPDVNWCLFLYLVAIYNTHKLSAVTYYIIQWYLKIL